MFDNIKILMIIRVEVVIVDVIIVKIGEKKVVMVNKRVMKMEDNLVWVFMVMLEVDLI